MKELLYSVLAFTKPGPKWRIASSSVPKPKALEKIQEVWKAGNKARLIKTAKDEEKAA